MAETERRAVPRRVFFERLSARVREAREVRLVDLSVQGARIEHRGLLSPGSPCRLELPAALGDLVLAAQVMWSTVIGAERTLQGERHLVSRTGLKFGTLTEDQRRALSETLEETTLAHPSLDGRGGTG